MQRPALFALVREPHLSHKPARNPRLDVDWIKLHCDDSPFVSRMVNHSMRLGIDSVAGEQENALAVQLQKERLEAQTTLLIASWHKIVRLDLENGGVASDEIPPSSLFGSIIAARLKEDSPMSDTLGARL